MASISASWGLNLDLGDQLNPETLSQLYQAIWTAPEFSGPRFKLGEYQGLPKAAEGELCVAEQAGKCYTKFELDNLGYPSSWQVPLSFSLSLFGFEQGLPKNKKLYKFLLSQLRRLGRLSDYRMAMIGDLGCYYLNAEFISESWVNLHQDAILALILPKSHPFARLHPGQKFGRKHFIYTQSELGVFWNHEDQQTRYLDFKKQLSHQLHSPSLNLEWEQPSDN
jgi:hypothetical protein